MTARVGARLWWGALLLILLAWALGLLIPVVIEGLPNPPWVTGPGVLLGRYVRDVAAALVVGSLVVGALLIDAVRARQWAARWTVVWLVVVAVLGVLTFAEVYAVSPVQSADALGTFFVQTSLGRVFAVQVGLLVLLLCSSPWWSRRVIAWPAVVLAMAAAMAPAFLGHGGLTGGHASATISLGLHLGGVVIWVGGLAACLALLAIEPGLGPVLMPRFSLLALWCVIVVAETGLVNASLRVGTPDLFVGTLYGSLVLCKAILLGWLIRLGWLQRRRAIPDLVSGPATLLRFGGWELIVMAITLAVSVLLSRMGPPTGIITSGAFEPFALLALALGLPLLLAWTIRPPRVLERLSASPEIPVVGLLVVMALIAGLRLPFRVVGLQAGAIIGSLVLVGVGWAAACAIRGPRGMTAIILLMVGWPAVSILAGVLVRGGLGWPGIIAQVVLAEAMLVAALVAVRRPPAIAADSIAGKGEIHA